MLKILFILLIYIFNSLMWASGRTERHGQGTRVRQTDKQTDRWRRDRRTVWRCGLCRARR